MLFFIINGYSQTDSLKQNVQFDPLSGKSYFLETREEFDPMTGLKLIHRDTIWINNEQSSDIIENTEIVREYVPDKPVEMAFDPITGLPIQKSVLPVISLARANAKRDYNQTPWFFCGGPANCGATLVGGSIGANFLGLPGFIGGAVATGLITPTALSNIPSNKPVIYPVSIKIEDKPLYLETYIKETKKKRQTSIFDGMIFGCALSAALGLLTLANL